MSRASLSESGAKLKAVPLKIFQSRRGVPELPERQILKQFPRTVKVYIENISAEGITFGCNENGLYGLCKAKWLLFLTTRGGIWADSDMEQGSTYMEALCKFFGIDEYACVYADGIDVQELDGEEILREAIEETKGICTRLSCE